MELKWKCVIFKCYSSEELITLNTLHEVVPTWYSFHSWVDWSNADKVSCSRRKHIDAEVRTRDLCIPNLHSNHNANCSQLIIIIMARDFHASLKFSLSEVKNVFLFVIQWLFRSIDGIEYEWMHTRCILWQHLFRSTEGIEDERMHTRCILWQCKTDNVTSHHGLKKFTMRWGCTVPSPLTWPSTTKRDDTKTFVMTGSVDGCCVQYFLTHLWVIFTTRFICSSFPSLYGSWSREVRVWHQATFKGSTPECPSRLSPEDFSTWGYFCNTVGIWTQSFSSPRWPAKGYQDSSARLQVMLLLTTSNQVIFAYDHVIRAHHSYCPCFGLPMGKP